MNTISRMSLLLPILCVGTSLPALADEVIVTITGEIKDVVCTPTINGSLGLNTLGLADIPVSALNAPNPPSVFGNTLVFSLSECDVSAAIEHMWVHFTADSISDGRINTNLSEVAFQIIDSATGNQVDVGGTAGSTGPTSNQGTFTTFSDTFPSRSATKSYAVHYYRKGASVTQTGEVTANATYTVKYF